MLVQALSNHGRGSVVSAEAGLSAMKNLSTSNDSNAGVLGGAGGCKGERVRNAVLA